MYITIKSKSKNGDQAIMKLMSYNSYGLATRSFITTTPLEVKITPIKQKVFSAFAKKNLYVVPAIDGPFRQMLHDFGAKDKDFIINVVL